MLLSTLNSGLGCTPWLAPDLADNNTLVDSCALYELSAMYWQQEPVGFIEAGNHMVVSLINQEENLDKLNAFRLGVGMAAVTSLQNASTTLFCQALGTVGTARFQSWSRFDGVLAPPDPTTATDFMGYLANRFIDTWQTLNCTGLVGFGSPVALEINEDEDAIGEVIVLQNNTIPTSEFEPGGTFFTPSRNVTL